MKGHKTVITWRMERVTKDTDLRKVVDDLLRMEAKLKGKAWAQEKEGR